MKRLLPIPLLVLALMFSGCAWVHRHTPWHHETPAGQPARAAAPAPTIVTPDNSLAAKVIRVNEVGRFVVLNFPDGRMPKLDEHLFLYRGGLKAAEVKVVGPQQDTNIVADLISGNAQVGDAVRDQ